MAGTSGQPFFGEGWNAMFDSLDERIKHDDAVETSRRERIGKWVMVVILSILLFGGLYFAVRVLE
jgi:hypothetical protein